MTGTIKTVKLSPRTGAVPRDAGEVRAWHSSTHLALDVVQVDPHVVDLAQQGSPAAESDMPFIDYSDEVLGGPRRRPFGRPRSGHHERGLSPPVIPN